MVRWIIWMVLLLATPAHAVDLEGSLQLTSGGKPLLASEASEAVVYFRPASLSNPPSPGAALPKTKPQTPVVKPVLLVTKRKQFLPHILPIMMGTTVQFPNQDTILHNVFSSTPGAVFDSGIYGMGEGARHTFENPGLVKVFCNVHHSMYGYILVLDTPHFTKPGVDGRFKLNGLPKQKGELVVFHDRGNPLRVPLDLSHETTKPALTLELNRRKVPAHTNKFGKPYGRANSAYQ